MKLSVSFLDCSGHSRLAEFDEDFTSQEALEDVVNSVCSLRHVGVCALLPQKGTFVRKVVLVYDHLNGYHYDAVRSLFKTVA